MKNVLVSAVSAMALTVGITAAEPAYAGAFIQAAAGACDGQRWQDQQALFRDLYRLRNDSGVGIRVICSVPMIADQIPPNSQYEFLTFKLHFQSFSTKAVKVTCSYVTPGGWNQDFAISISQSFGANESAVISMPLEGYRINTAGIVVSCNLPPHMAITTIDGTFHEWEFIEM
jgi:hypothetical protein